MKTLYHKNFLKNYRKRIDPNKKLSSQFETRFDQFLKDSKNPALKDHKLTGEKKDRRAFSVTGDIRVVYKKFDDSILLYDIGSHNQVY